MTLPVFAILFFLCIGADAQIKKNEGRAIPTLNQVQEVSLQTTYSNESDASVVEKTNLYLSDYDKKNNISILEATGDRSKPGAQEYIPYIKEKCDGGICGIADASGSLDGITLEKAQMALKKQSSAASIDKSKFKEGSLWIVHSETPDKTSGKKWNVTIAIELKKFAKNTKYVNLKYKVLEFVSK